jgi:hypothetical protein
MEPMTFTLVFSQPLMKPFVGTAGQVEIQFIPTLAVSIPPMLAKQLASILQDSVNEYEKHVGPIPNMPATPIPSLVRK